MKKLMHFCGLAWKVCPSYILLLAVQALAAAGKLWLNVILPKFLVEELVGNKELRILCLFGGLIVLNNVGMAWLEKLLQRLLEVRRRYVRHAMIRHMAEKIMNLDYACLEDPYYLDLKESAAFAIRNQDAISRMILCISDLFSGALTLVGLAVILATLGPVLLIVQALGIGVMLLLAKRLSKYTVLLSRQIIPINRKFGYYLGLQTEKQYQKDIRLYDMGDMITERVSRFTHETCDLFDEMNVQSGKTQGSISVINDFLAVFSYVYVGLRT
ncbi:MAG: hypothetical protein K2I21_09630, partial [Acetatifactor sp.]|nr:hypothetical protein [Acetatifactor sp.]